VNPLKVEAKLEKQEEREKRYRGTSLRARYSKPRINSVRTANSRKRCAVVSNESNEQPMARF
jgi:hypothetical protein